MGNARESRKSVWILPWNDRNGEMEEHYANMKCTLFEIWIYVVIYDVIFIWIAYKAISGFTQYIFKVPTRI